MSEYGNKPVGKPVGSGGPQGGGGQQRGRIEELLRPPAQKVVYFVGNDRKAIDGRLLAEEAEKVARNLAEVPASQLRRFYAEVMSLKRRAELAGATDEEVRARMLLLRAKAAYTWGRQKKYPDELVTFFTRHAASVQTRDDFLRGFQPHFEAVMAFHRVFENKKDAAA
jgi:CRISPR-associated protein Csm2